MSDSWYNVHMMKLTDLLRRHVYSLRAALRESPVFGVLLLGLLGTALLFSPFGGTYFEAIKYPWAISITGLLIGMRVFRSADMRSAYGIISIAFLAWSVFAAIGSPSFIVALIGNFPRYNSSVLLFLFFVTVLWAAIHVVREGKARWLVGVLLSVGGFAAGFAVLQMYGLASYTGVESFFLAVPNRVGSLLGNPNFSSLFLACVLPFALVRALRAQTWGQRAWTVLLVFILCWSLALLASRGAILAAMVGVAPVIVWLIWLRRWKQLVLLVVGLLGCMFLFSGYFFLYRGETAATLVTAQDTSAVDRYVAWDMARDLLVRHPWFGYGPASFQQYYWEYLPSGLMAQGLYFDDAHNTLVHIAAAVGLPGLLLFILLIALAAARAVRTLVGQWHDERASLLVAAFGALGVWLVGSSFNPVTPALYMQLALVLAILYTGGLADAEGSQPSSKAAQVPLRSIGAVLVVYGVCMIVGNQLFLVATRYHARQDFSRAYMYTRLASRVDALSPLLKVARVATMQSAGVPLEQVRPAIQQLVGQSWATSPRIALQIADIAGQVEMASGDPQDQRAVEQALALARQHGPTYPDAYVQSAYYLARFGKASEAVIYGQKGVLLQPKNYLTWLVMARAYQAANNVDGVVLALRRAQELRPHDKLLPILRRRLQETGDPLSINLLPQKTFVLLSLQ